MKKIPAKGFLRTFRVYDLILVAMLTALSIGIKTAAGTLVRMITGPLGIPGGALAGGFYMLWLPLAIALTGKRGAALIVAALQTLIMITTGAPGSHGVWTVLTYMLPAVPVELIFFFRKKGYTVLHFLAAASLANIAGTFLINQLFFRMSFYPLMFTLLAAALSGAAGGVIACFVYRKAEKSGLIKKHIDVPQAEDSQPVPATNGEYKKFEPAEKIPEEKKHEKEFD